MNIIIQCAASKSAHANYLLDSNGQSVLFVADPSLAPSTSNHVYARPDDRKSDGTSWREVLVKYNQDDNKNPLKLLPCYQLYRNPVYGRLVERFGLDHVFILSAGWGLISADFLIPNYDITFSASAEKYKRRRKSAHHDDLQQLPLSSCENLIFFGGKDYIPLFCKLTQDYAGARFLPFNSISEPNAPDCKLVRFNTTTRTNWHYECARAYLEGKFDVVRNDSLE